MKYSPNKFLTRALLITQLLIGTAAFAEGSSGVRGGGTVVDVNSTPYLMDLVSKSVCTFKSGMDLASENAELKTVLDDITRLDWYFGLELKRELGYLTYCFTGPLYRIPEHGNQSGVVPQALETNTRQAAYRLNEKAYVDSAIYNAMNTHQQAYLILHEMLHSYLPMNLLDRKLMLRSFVKALERVQTGDIKTRKGLYFQMSSAGVQFPQNTDSLDRFEKQVSFVLSGQDERVAAIRADAAPESLAQVSTELLKRNLAPWDSAELEKSSTRQVFKDALAEAMMESDSKQFVDLMSKPYHNVNFFAVAYEFLPKIEKSNQDLLFASAGFKAFFNQSYLPVNLATVVPGEYRVLANEALVRLTAEGRCLSGTQALTDLHGVTQVPSDLAWLSNSIVYLIQNERMEQVVELVTENPAFYQVLGLKTATLALQSIVPHVPREKQVAEAVLKELKEKLIQSILSEVRSKVLSSEYQVFTTKIHYERF